MTDDPEDLAVTFAEMSRILLAKESLEETLAAIVHLATQVVDGCEHAGISTTRHGGRIDTATSDELARRSDALQYELREGPCYDVLWKERIFHVDDMAAETRWPRYAPRAVDLGIGSAMGLQLYTNEDTLGALNLYSCRPHAFDETACRVGMIFSAHAAVAFAWARTEAQLRDAIVSRQVIGEAMGILIERRRLTPDQAFDVLRRASQNHNVKLREVAERVVETGEEPERTGH